MIYRVFSYFVFLLFSLTFFCSATAQTSGIYFFDTHDVTICPAIASSQTPPDFSSEPCKKANAEDIDPQNAFIWVKVKIPLTARQGQNGEPLSLYISGKMSSEVYLNGQFVGRNGTPGIDAASEIPGRMDAELFPPQNLFILGDNEIVFRASSHHGFLRLHEPLHMVAIAPTGLYAKGVLPHISPALMMLGLFILGALYFGIMGFIGASYIRSWGLSAICIFAAGQLVFEVLRGLVPYAYPVHDVRLLAIALFSTAFGLSVAFQIFHTFMQSKAVRIVAGLAVLCTAALIITTGFDFKALAGMTIPLLASLIATGVWTYKSRTRAFPYFIALLVFIASIFIFKGFFLDTIFFALVALLLLFLFAEQAVTLAKEARIRRSEETRANRLELALAEAEERNEARQITIKSAGKVQRIATNQIVQCHGASGYSEIVLVGGRTILHTASLNEMEETLPATFLRVHRSHLVNLMFVEALSRDPAGTGTLSLSEGSEVPVSRRILPKVRQALS
jgi:DNA-binding LytR/AlgR family response regulator